MTHRSQRLLVGLTAVATLLVGQVSVANATVWHIYAGQSSTTVVDGVDGYIYTTKVTMAHPTANGIANFLNLCSSTSCGQWVQLGPFQGTFGTGTCPGVTCIQSTTAIHMYWENLDGCSDYDNADLGAPPTPNYPYYVTRTGTTITLDCGVEKKYAFRFGSFVNPPSGYGYMSSTGGIPIVETEQKYDDAVGGMEPFAVTYYGLNNSHAINHSYAVRLYNLGTGVWSLWDTAVATVTFHDNPPYYKGAEHWSAFDTQPTAP